MTVKELKHMLENADDNAIVVVRNNWAPAEFLNTSARKMVLVKANGKLMTPKGRGERVYLRRPCYVGNFIRLR